MSLYLRLGLSVLILAALAGCGPDYSPNTYSTAAVQQANKVDQGVIAGFREVAIRADGTVGAVTGGAAGGVLGAQAPEGGVVTALSAIGGTLVGGLIGTGVEHAAGDTKAFEYLVRKPGGDLISVTQKDETPLPVGLKVLVIEGKQARIVADYSVPPEPPAPSATGASAKNDKSNGDKANKPDKATSNETDKAATAKVAPQDIVPAPAPQSAPVETQPASAAAPPLALETQPASATSVTGGGASLWSPIPQASAAPAPPMTSPAAPEEPAPTAASPATQSDQSAPTPAAPAAAPTPAESKPTP